MSDTERHLRLSEDRRGFAEGQGRQAELSRVRRRSPGAGCGSTSRTITARRDYIELMDFRGYGKQLTHTPLPDASGTYETNYGNFHLKQEGTSVTGCYEHDGGLLNGGIEGRIMKFTCGARGRTRAARPSWSSRPTASRCSASGGTRGRATRTAAIGTATKISNEVGSCPHWTGTGAEAQMTKDLEELGRTRIYGINFDTDSDVIKRRIQADARQDRGPDEGEARLEADDRRPHRLERRRRAQQRRSRRAAPTR